MNCEHCHMKFMSEFTLVNHKREQHSNSATLHCSVCSKPFKNAKFLKNHEERHRTGELSAEDGEFMCNLVLDGSDRLCGKVFKQRCNLERHIR